MTASEKLGEPSTFLPRKHSPQHSRPLPTVLDMTPRLPSPTRADLQEFSDKEMDILQSDVITNINTIFDSVDVAVVSDGSQSSSSLGEDDGNMTPLDFRHDWTKLTAEHVNDYLETHNILLDVASPIMSELSQRHQAQDTEEDDRSVETIEMDVEFALSEGEDLSSDYDCFGNVALEERRPNSTGEHWISPDMW